MLNCDASDYAIGGVLYQRNYKGGHKVIAHVSRSLKGAEKNYFTSEKEIQMCIRDRVLADPFSQKMSEIHTLFIQI